MDFCLLINISIHEGNNCPKSIILKEKETIIGRKGDIIIDTNRKKEISKKHAIIYKKKNHLHIEWIIQDLGSLNGTFVNDRKVLKQNIKHKDIIVFGCNDQIHFGDIVDLKNSECRYLFIIPSLEINFDQCIDYNNIIDLNNEKENCSICMN